MFDPSILNGTLWLAEPLRLMQAVERIRRIPECPSARKIAKLRQVRLEAAKAASTKAIRTAKGRVGVIPVMGPIEQRMSAALMKLGGTSTEEISVALDSMLADSSIDAIVFQFDSPGGSVAGVQELADKIFAARAQKKTYAVADSMAASAGYWLASAAEILSVTPGGDVGSVGVYAMHVDQSKALEEEGLKVTLIHAGKYKTEANFYEPLGTEARDFHQGQVDAIHEKFIAALARNRDVAPSHVRERFGQGRLLNAEQALDRKLVDRVLSMDDLMGKLLGSAGAKKASAEVLRLRLEQQRREENFLPAP